MSFPPYASYKDSGVEWLGEVPSSWNVKRLRFVAALNPSRNEVAELPDDVELSFIPMEAVGEEGELDLSRTRRLGEVRNGYSYFADGDVVFAKVTPCLENGKGALMRDLVGAKGFGTTELTVLRPTSPEDGRFLWWLTKAPEFRGPASGEMIGAGGLKRVPDEFVANFAAPWPPAQDRQSITDFLDRETAKIDGLIAGVPSSNRASAIGEFVALLTERRAALISAAVTGKIDVRGLAPRGAGGVTRLLFLDESGHDHRNMPLEVRGGVAIHAGKLWSFVQSWQRLERDCFGAPLAEFGKEAKGYKLLDRDRFKWAAQGERQDDDLRRKNALRFLNAGPQGLKPRRDEFTAYGQACLEMVRGVFDLLSAHDAKLFAAAIPRGVKPPPDYARTEDLRRDHVFLFERFYYFLEEKREHGLLIMDQSEKTLDRRFIAQMEAYFTRTAIGRNRSYWIVPAPLMVSSDITYAVQAADICLYALNWGFRLSQWGGHPSRPEIAEEFGPKLMRLQWDGQGSREGRTYHSWGIVYVDDPYREAQELTA